MNSKAKVIAMCAIAVGLNVVLGEAVSMLRIPLLFLDTMGTIFIAANFGMGYGILTGVTTNLLMGLIGGVTAIPFALVNVAVAIISEKWFWFWKSSNRRTSVSLYLSNDWRTNSIGPVWRFYRIRNGCRHHGIASVW